MNHFIFIFQCLSDYLVFFVSLLFNYLSDSNSENH